MRHLFAALLVVACRQAEPAPVVPPRVDAAPLALPLAPVRVDDLIFDRARSGGDALRGLGAVHGYYFGGGPVSSGCAQGRQLRVGDIVFPRTQICGNGAGQFLRFRAWRTTRGRTVDVSELVALLTAYMGPPVVRGAGPTWVQTWQGDEVVVTVRMNDSVRLEIEGALRSDSIARALTNRWPQTLDDLPTTPRGSDDVPHGLGDALTWEAFVDRNVREPRIGCHVPGGSGVRKALFLTLYEEPTWVPIVDAYVWIPVTAEETSGILVLDGYEDAEIRWRSPESAWCSERVVLVPLGEP